MALLRFRLRLPLSLSLSATVFTALSRPVDPSQPRGLSIFQTELKLLGSPLRNIDSLPFLSLSFSRRERDEGKGENFQLCLSILGKNSAGSMDAAAHRFPFERNSYRRYIRRGISSLTRLRGGETKVDEEGDKERKEKLG